MATSSARAHREFCRKLVPRIRHGSESGASKDVQSPMPTGSLPTDFLHSFPAEILLSVLGFLDFQSLSRLSRTSSRAKDVVESLPAYLDMMEHTPNTLTALGETGLIGYHSSALLRQTLRGEKCASCFDFGGFLFLPTCERVCLECLSREHAFRVTGASTAKKCYGLSEKHIKTIPIMHNTPGKNLTMQDPSLTAIRLVSIKQARQLAVEVHGSVENSLMFEPSLRSAGLSIKNLFPSQQSPRARLEPPGFCLSALGGPSPGGNDGFCGLAAVRFPFLSDGPADAGSFCLRSEANSFRYRFNPQTLPEVLELVPLNPSLSERFEVMKTRLRLRGSTHIKHRHGARERLNKLILDK